MEFEKNKLISDVLEVFRQYPERKYTAQQITDFLRLHGTTAYNRVLKALAVLEGEDKIAVNNNNQFKLAPINQTVTGNFRANDRGFGFVRYDEEEPDIFIAKPNTLHAINDDEVEVKIIKPANPWGDNGAEGKITKIIDHGVKQLVGEFMPYSDVQAQKTGLIGYVHSYEKKLANNPVFIKSNGLVPQMGDMVQVEIESYPNDQFPRSMMGIALKTLGNKNAPGVDEMTIVYQNDVKDEFPPEVLQEAQTIPDKLQPQDWQGRRDNTKQQVVTIDGDDSKDFDDAVTVWKLENGNYHLGVHIADVTHYVKPDSWLDKEAYERGTSTYLVDRVIPMLPFRLSNGICSLNPGEDRCTLTCDMEINADGKVVHHEIYPSVIRSHARLTYNNVNKILAGDEQLRTKYQELVPMLEEMAQLHDILFNMRHHRGAIDFEETEAQIIVDENGKPLDIKLRERGTSEKMIESFMLAANETVAEHYNKMHVPFLYRVHEQPDGDKVKNFFEIASSFGLSVPGNANDVTPKMFQAVLEKVAGKPQETVITTMLLRSLQQAKYSPDPLGHFGLAATYYTHFTSPIRRYPDLMVHRMIHSYADEGTELPIQDKWDEQLPEVAVHTSACERKSIDVERAVDDLKKAEFMMDKVGQEYDGVINSVMSFGMFVSLENTVEGLVHISNMLDDYYEYHEKELSLVGKSTHKTYTMGDPIKVRLIRADAQQRQVDFEPVLTAEEQERADAEKQRRQEAKRSFSNRRRQNSNTDHKHKYSGNRSNKYERKS
ncbi:MAG: ribonuclease R [Lactobacillus sp.]|uniref:Ribonuclease R n=1 Tax=Bombilactobacillus bombi TaxID=1303590 RepID=A0A3R6W9K8_9LACO|nr:ribonuclease R [Bombilactobacillus bombi]MCO6542666.1 ribonuclease R [Lactobacillus sp.]RHW50088.1 ribonuclease R [Bombilactobacillus bombi]